MLKIAGIQGDITDAIDQLDFDSLTLSDDTTVSDVFKECLENKIYAHIGNSKKKFITHFKKSLRRGICDGQVHSFFMHGCRMKKIRTTIHIIDSIVFQMLYEIKYDVKQLLDGHFVTSPLEFTGEKSERFGSCIGFGLTKEKTKNCHKLVDKIEKKIAGVFSGLKKKEKIVIPGSFESEHKGVVDTSKVEKIFSKYSEVRLFGEVLIEDDRDDQHSFSLVKYDNRYLLYNGCNVNGYMLERSHSLSSIMNEFQKLLTSLYKDGVDHIRFTAYVPANVI